MEKNIPLNLPYYTPIMGNAENKEDIQRETTKLEVLEHTLRAHYWGLFKIESDEKYFELRRLVKRSKLKLAFYNGMERAEVVALWESHEKDIAKEAAGIYW